MMAQASWVWWRLRRWRSPEEFQSLERVQEARKSCPLLDIGPGGGVGVVGVRADHPGAAKPEEIVEKLHGPLFRF